MHKYRGTRLIRTGLLGLVLVVLIIVVGLQPQQLIQMATSVRYHAEFAEAGGLTAGNEVKVSGVTVGTVSDVELVNGRARVTFALDGKTRLDRTRRRTSAPAPCWGSEFSPWNRRAAGGSAHRV